MEGIVGQIIDGRYKIIKKIGEGGMGAVYLAEDLRLERQVAVKRLQIMGKKADLDMFQKRFEREAKEMARFQHTNIVSVHDYGQDDEGIYLVLEYMPGGSLIDRMRQGVIPVEEAVKILLPLAEALQAIHDRDRVHRDVKPSNILFDGYGKPKLADFGVVKLVEGGQGYTLTATGAVVGTPAYMAPELIGGEASPATDQYALGVVLYEMVTGKKPFVGRTPVETLTMHKYQPLPDPLDANPELPGWVCQALCKALSKESEDRYTVIDDFAAALRGHERFPAPESTVYAPIEEDDSPQEDNLKTILPTSLPEERVTDSPQKVLEVFTLNQNQSPVLETAEKKRNWIAVVSLFLFAGILLSVGILLITGGFSPKEILQPTEIVMALSTDPSATEILTTTAVSTKESTITLTTTRTPSPTLTSTPEPTATETITPTPLPEGKVLVPNVTGMSYFDAFNRIIDAGLTYRVTNFDLKDSSMGKIVSQSLMANSLVEIDSRIDLVISGESVGAFSYAYNTSSPFTPGPVSIELISGYSYLLFAYIDSCSIEDTVNQVCEYTISYDRSLVNQSLSGSTVINAIFFTPKQTGFYTFNIGCDYGYRYYSPETVVNYCSTHGVIIRID